MPKNTVPSVSDLFHVRNRTVCVTGASSGLGRAIATWFCQLGAKVVGVARRRDQLQQWQQESDGDTAFVVADLANQSALQTVIEEIISCYGHPDIIINAAGINLRQPAGSVTFTGWQETLQVNLTTPFFLAQSCIPAMEKKRWGRIINFASLQSRRAFPGGLAYGASKGGIDQLTRAMAAAWSASGITVNAIAPGFFPTELTAPVFTDTRLRTNNAKQTCIGRNGEIADIYGPVLFLCSPAASYITGQTLFVDGGFTAK